MQGRDLYTQYPKSTARSSRCERRVGQETSEGKPCHINEKSSSLHTCINRLISRSRECRLLRKSSQIRKSLWRVVANRQLTGGTSPRPRSVIRQYAWGSAPMRREISAQAVIIQFQRWPLRLDRET